MRILGVLCVLAACGGDGSEADSLSGTFKGPVTGDRDGVAFATTWTMEIDANDLRTEGTWTASDGTSGTILIETSGSGDPSDPYVIHGEVDQTMPCFQSSLFQGTYVRWSHLEAAYGGPAALCPTRVGGNFSLDRE